MKHWNRIPREVDIPLLEIQGQVGWALSNPFQGKMFLSMAGGWTRWPLKVPPNPNHSIIIPTMKQWSSAKQPKKSEIIIKKEVGKRLAPHFVFPTSKGSAARA